jgi:hypothetical protein
VWRSALLGATRNNKGVPKMFANLSQRRDFADTRALEPLGVESALLFLRRRSDNGDAADSFAQANAADNQLLRLVSCVAGATLVLALVASL